MKAVLSTKGQLTIPQAIRERLGLKPGQLVEFDESVPYLKATLVVDKEAMIGIIGIAAEQLSGNDVIQLLGQVRDLEEGAEG